MPLHYLPNQQCFLNQLDQQGLGDSAKLARPRKLEQQPGRRLFGSKIGLRGEVGFANQDCALDICSGQIKSQQTNKQGSRQAIKINNLEQVERSVSQTRPLLGSFSKVLYFIFFLCFFSQLDNIKSHSLRENIV